MLKSREEIVERIYEILGMFNDNTLVYPLKESINLFSNNELLQLLEFLETGKNESIYQFLDDKYKEYLAIMEEIKSIEIKEKKLEFLKIEKEEREKEEKNLESLINF